MGESLCQCTYTTDKGHLFILEFSTINLYFLYLKEFATLLAGFGFVCFGFFSRTLCIKWIEVTLCNIFPPDTKRHFSCGWASPHLRDTEAQVLQLQRDGIFYTPAVLPKDIPAFLCHSHPAAGSAAPLVVLVEWFA